MAASIYKKILPVSMSLMSVLSLSLNIFKSERKENICLINCSLFPEVSKLSEVYKEIMSDKEKFL